MHFSRRCANIFRQSRDAIKNPGVAKFGIALEWGSRGLEFESRHSDQKRAFSMKMPVFYNFLKDIIFLKLALLLICYQCQKRLQSVGDAAETIHIHGGKTGGQFFHDPAKCTESGAAYLTDDKQKSGDRVVSALIVLRYSTAASVQLAGWRRRSARPRWRQRSAKTAR